MNKININNLLSKASYLKLAGVNKFILIDVFKNKLDILLVRNSERAYKFIGSLNQEDYEIISFERKEYSGLIEDIAVILKEFVKKHKAEDAYLIVGINEYRTKILTINKEVEDVNLWFLENTDRFIPSGRSAKEFSFSYERYKEDDDNYFYLVAITRGDYVAELTKVCSNCGLNLLSITTFPLSIHALAFTNDVRAVFIKVTDEVINYSYTDVNNNLFVNELYHKIFSVDFKGNVNEKEIEYSLNQIVESIIVASNSNELGELNVYLSVHEDYYEVIKLAILRMLNPSTVNKNFEKINSVDLACFFALLKELTFLEVKINFLKKEIIFDKRNEIEKQITFRIALASGALLLSLLLISFAVEMLISGKINAGQESLLEVNAKKALVTKYEEENTKFVSNLFHLKELKEKRSTCSKLMKSLSDVVTAKSWYTGLRFRENDEDKPKIEVVGIALNQQEVATIMKNLENIHDFKNILLLYSNTTETKNVKTNLRISQNEVIEFKLLCEYENAD